MIVREDPSIPIEQPDPGRLDSRRLAREELPRLGFFPDSRLDRLKLLLALLPDAALVGPALAPLGAPLFGGRPFHVGITRLCEGVARRGGFFIGLFSGL